MIRSLYLLCAESFTCRRITTIAKIPITSSNIVIVITKALNVGIKKEGIESCVDDIMQNITQVMTQTNLPVALPSNLTTTSSGSFHAFITRKFWLHVVTIQTEAVCAVRKLIALPVQQNNRMSDYLMKENRIMKMKTYAHLAGITTTVSIIPVTAKTSKHNDFLPFTAN